VLFNDLLLYTSPSESDTKTLVVRNVLSLRNLTVAVLERTDKKKNKDQEEGAFPFTLLKEGDEHALVFKVGSEEERDAWLLDIRRCSQDTTLIVDALTTARATVKEKALISPTPSVDPRLGSVGGSVTTSLEMVVLQGGADDRESGDISRSTLSCGPNQTVNQTIPKNIESTTSGDMKSKAGKLKASTTKMQLSPHKEKKRKKGPPPPAFDKRSLSPRKGGKVN
jgi:hypothetical protein